MKINIGVLFLFSLIVYSSEIYLNVYNKCDKNIVVFFDKYKPPCDREAKKIPQGECVGGDLKGKGWWDERNGNIPNQKMIKPNDEYSIKIPTGSDNKPEWCFDEAGKRVCSGSGGWVGYDCELINETYHCKSGSDNGFPYWPNRFEPNFNPLGPVIFYNLSGVDGINVNMKFSSNGTCEEKDKSTVCNINLDKCPYPDKENESCESQCQACNRIKSGSYPKYWDVNDFIDPSTLKFVNCDYLCAVGSICQDKLHEECAQRVVGNNQTCCLTGECGGETCKYSPVLASKKWCDFIHGKQGGECDIYCWAYDDDTGTRACGCDGDLNLEVTCSFDENRNKKLKFFS